MFNVTVARAIGAAKQLQSRAWLAVVVLHIVQAVALVAVSSHALFCCDANYYLQGGRFLLGDGLLWGDPHAGYRFYLTPALFGVLERVTDMLFGEESTRSLMPYVLSVLFAAVSAIASIFVFRKDGMKRWAMFAVPILLNPLALGIVPYPLQESVVCIFAFPLLLVLLAHRFRYFATQCIVAALLIGLTFLGRSTFLWICLPLIFLVCARAFRERVPWPISLRGGALAVVIVLLLYAPQAYINWNKFNTFLPIANSEVGRGQIVFGVDMLNYGAVYRGTTFSGLASHSPFKSLPPTEKTLSFYLVHPKAGFVLVLAHTWSSLHFVTFVPYAPFESIDIITVPLLVSSVIVFYGLLGLFQRLRDPNERDVAIFLLITLLLSCVYTAFAATENRFGIFAFVAVTITAWQVLMFADTRKLAVRTIPFMLIYVSFCILTNALLMYRTGEMWPHSMPF